MEKLQQTAETDWNSSQNVGQEYICSKCRNLEKESSTSQHDGPSKCEQVFSKLRLHYVPSDAENTAILSTIRTELGTVNQDLTRLKTVIERLEAQKVELELEIRYQTALLSPIRRLPDEILSEIFLFCSGGRVDVCSQRSEIWRIERVCKRWQDVAISLQEVWSSIDVNLGSLMPYKAGIPMATVNRLASLCLQRSGERSLSIKFIEIGITSHFEKIFRLLSRCSDRWADLSFSLSMLETSHEFEHGITRLKSLELYGNYKGPAPMDAFKQAERLSQLRLYCVSRPLRHLVLPWSQIQYFDVSVCNFWPGEFTDMLSLMPNLVKFVSKWNRGLVGPNLPPIIKQVRLRHLRVFVFEASLSDIYTTLRPLYVSSLSELSIHCRNPNASNTHYSYISDSVVDFIRCSGCSITTLSLSSVDSACVSRILEATPTLVDLDLVYIQGIEYNLHELSQPAAIVPRLETFSLTCKGNQGIVAIAPLMEVLRNRSRLQQGIQPAIKRLDLTLREQRGINYFVRMLGPLSRQLGIQIILHSLAI